MFWGILEFPSHRLTEGSRFKGIPEFLFGVLGAKHLRGGGVSPTKHCERALASTQASKIFKILNSKRTSMILFVALGNIGKEYENTRHNAGFMLADLLISSGGFIAQSSAKFKGELYKKGPVLLLKPSTYMNLSGESVLAVANFYHPERIIVAHDDIDLPLGALRFKLGGSSGGHNGIKNIDKLIGSEYERVRIGVGKSQNRDTINWVLGAFSSDEKSLLDTVLKTAFDACLAAFSGSDIKELSSKFSLKPLKEQKA